MKKPVFAVMLLLALGAGAQAGQLYVGNDTSSPVAVYTTGGTFVQFFGQNSATGSAIDPAGDVWTVAPSFGNNQVVEYNQSQTVLNSFIATVNGEWIEDMSHGAGNTLWVSTFEGDVFALNDQTGAIMSTFSIPNSSYAGIAFDGTNLWASGGLTSDNLYLFDTSGTLLNTFALGTKCGGVGFDSTDGTLYCGDFGSIHHYTTGGVLLGSFTTSSGAYHDGLEVANIGTVTGIPEPASVLFMGTGLVALLLARRRERQ